MAFRKTMAALFVGSLVGVLWGAAVDQSFVGEKVAQIDQEIQTLSSSLAGDRESQKSLQSQVQEQQAQLASLEAELRVQEEQAAAQKERQQAQTQHEDVAIQEALVGLREEIRAQESAVAQQRAALSHTVAVDTSDVIIRLEGELQKDEKHLTDLKEQYFAIIEARQAKLRENQRLGSEQAQTEQAGQVVLDFATTQAQTNLQQLKSEMDQVKKESEQKERRIQELRAARSEAMSSSPQQTPSPPV